MLLFELLRIVTGAERPLLRGLKFSEGNSQVLQSLGIQLSDQVRQLGCWTLEDEKSQLILKRGIENDLHAQHHHREQFSRHGKS